MLRRLLVVVLAVIGALWLLGTCLGPDDELEVNMGPVVTGPGLDELRRIGEVERNSNAQAELDRLAEASRLEGAGLVVDHRAIARAMTPPTTRPTAPRPSRSGTRLAPAPAAPVAVPAGDVWVVLADCESGDGDVGPPFSMNPSARGRFFGAFQFSTGTWNGLGYSGTAADHPYATQLEGAQRLVARSGWGQFPSCSGRMRAAGYL